MAAGEDVQKDEPPAKRPRGRPKGSGKKSGGCNSHAMFLLDLFSKPVFSDEATPPTTVAGAPNSSKVTDWTSVPWNELGQTSDSR